MQDSHIFFKPYRERIHEMRQHHDSLEQNPDQSPQARPYFGYSPSANNLYTEWANNDSPNRKYSPASNSKNQMKQINYNNTRKHTKLGREMHEPIWQHLYNEGRRLQQEIMESHKQKQHQIDSECTFQPILRKSSRYRIPTSSNFLERNYIWQETKLQKIVKQKEEEVVKDLQNCTFKPKLNKYKLTSNKYHHLKPSKSLHTLESKNKTMKEENVGDKQKKNFNQKERGREKKMSTMNRQEVGKIKNIIRTQLKRIQL